MKQTVYEVVDRITGKRYECVPQMLDLNFNGKYVLRYNIGIEGYTEWTNIHCIYDNDEFNVRYKVVGSHESVIRG